MCHNSPDKSIPLKLTYTLSAEIFSRFEALPVLRFPSDMLSSSASQYFFTIAALRMRHVFVTYARKPAASCNSWSTSASGSGSIFATSHSFFRHVMTGRPPMVPARLLDYWILYVRGAERTACDNSLATNPYNNDVTPEKYLRNESLRSTLTVCSAIDMLCARKRYCHPRDAECL